MRNLATVLLARHFGYEQPEIECLASIRTAGRIDSTHPAGLIVAEQVFAEMQEGLHQFGVKLVLELTAALMEEKVERQCGARYVHQAERKATRYGSQPGVVTIAGQKMRIRRPRVRSGREGKEIPLELYGMAQCEEAMPEAVLRRMVRGVSCRNYEGVIETAKESLGVKRSSVSRSFHFASKKKIAELAERRFDDIRFPVIFIDGLCWAGTTMIVALNIAANGQKHVLGFREGRTENVNAVWSHSRLNRRA